MSETGTLRRCLKTQTLEELKISVLGKVLAYSSARCVQGITLYLALMEEVGTCASLVALCGVNCLRAAER